jgi:hypothetical protein
MAIGSIPFSDQGGDGEGKFVGDIFGRTVFDLFQVTGNAKFFQLRMMVVGEPDGAVTVTANALIILDAFNRVGGTDLKFGIGRDGMAGENGHSFTVQDFGQFPDFPFLFFIHAGILAVHGGGVHANLVPSR